MLQLSQPSVGSSWHGEFWRRNVMFIGARKRWAAQLSIDPLGRVGTREAILPNDRSTTTSSLWVGEPTVVEVPSPSARFSVVFEDDGEAGYFYGLDPSRGEQPILDALFIYNVAAIPGRDRPSVLQVTWSASGEQAALLINSLPHAVFDFAARRGYCRSGFPPSPQAGWATGTHEWHEEALDHFR